MTYIREFDRATMIEIAPHCYLNETAERAFRLHRTSVTGLKHHEDKHDDNPIGPIERVTQMAKQFSDSTIHSDISAESTNSVDCSSLIPLRDRLVGPDVPASSPSHRRSRSMLFTSCLVGVILAGGISAVIAFRQFSLADIWRGRAQLHQPTLTMRGEQRLIVRSSRGSSGEPIPLGLTIYGPAEGVVIIITGLLPGMELSNGIEVDVDRWEVPATEVSYAWIAPPDGFVGSALLTAELRLTDDSIADRQAIQLEWVPSSPPGFTSRQ